MYPLQGYAGPPYVGAPAMMPDQPPYYVPQPPMGIMPGYAMPGVQPMAMTFGVAPPMVQQFNPFSVPPPPLPAPTTVEVQQEGKKKSDNDWHNHDERKAIKEDKTEIHDDEYYKELARRKIREKENKIKSTPTERDPISSGSHHDRREREKKTKEHKSSKEGQSTKGHSKYQDDVRDEQRNQDKGTLLL